MAADNFMNLGASLLSMSQVRAQSAEQARQQGMQGSRLSMLLEDEDEDMTTGNEERGRLSYLLGI